MKKISSFSKLVVIILSFWFFQNCTKDTIDEYSTIELKFFDSQKYSKNNDEPFNFYNVELNDSNEIIGYDSDLYLIEEVTHEETGQISSMIIELFQHKNGGIETGWFFQGSCFVYGTMYYGSNGVNLFVPCGINCIGFDDVCASPGTAYAIL